jgi:hypothetical protein
VSQNDAELQGAVQEALDKLTDQFIKHPAVTLIDAGYSNEGEQKNQIVLRIHVRDRWMKNHPTESNTFPSAVDNIPVILVPGDFYPEAT